MSAKKESKFGGMAQVADHPPSKYRALSSNPSTTKKIYLVLNLLNYTIKS
jgi:hypothetical protein